MLSAEEAKRQSAKVVDMSRIEREITEAISLGELQVKVNMYWYKPATRAVIEAKLEAAGYSIIYHYDDELTISWG